MLTEFYQSSVQPSEPNTATPCVLPSHQSQIFMPCPNDRGRFACPRCVLRSRSRRRRNMSFTVAATRGPVLCPRLRLQLRLLGADFQVPTTPRKAVRKGHETKSTSAGPQQSKKHNMLRHFSRRWSGKMSSPLAALAPPRRFGPATTCCLLAARPMC